MKKLTRLFTAVLSIVSSMVVTGNVFGNIATRRTVPMPQSQQANQTVSIDLRKRTNMPEERISESEIPQHEGRLVTVRSGDTLWGLARNGGVSVEELKAANNLKSDNIWVGQQLVIPAPVDESVEVTPVIAESLFVEATAYCPCFSCCGKHEWESDYGITASGYDVFSCEKNIIAADTDVLPFGTEVKLYRTLPSGAEEFIGTYTVEDRGGGIKGERIDIFYFSHEEALNFGRNQLRLEVVSQPNR